MYILSNIPWSWGGPHSYVLRIGYCFYLFKWSSLQSQFPQIVSPGLCYTSFLSVCWLDWAPLQISCVSSVLLFLWYSVLWTLTTLDSSNAHFPLLNSGSIFLHQGLETLESISSGKCRAHLLCFLCSFTPSLILKN